MIILSAILFASALLILSAKREYWFAYRL